jgi:hypothetical protein
MMILVPNELNATRMSGADLATIQEQGIGRGHGVIVAGARGKMLRRPARTIAESTIDRVPATIQSTIGAQLAIGAYSGSLLKVSAEIAIRITAARSAATPVTTSMIMKTSGSTISITVRSVMEFPLARAGLARRLHRWSRW